MKKPSAGMRKKIMSAVMLAHQSGVQKGAQQAAPPPGAGAPPPGPPPGIAGLPPGGPAGMKKGGAVKEKWVPPWIKKAEGKKKYATGGSVRGGRGDGCCAKGGTRGRMV